MMLARLANEGVPVKVHLEMARAYGAGRGLAAMWSARFRGASIPKRWW